MEEKKNVFGTISFILGIVSIFFIFCGIGIIPGIIGLVFAIVGLAKNPDSKQKAFATIGIVLSVVSFVLFIFFVVFAVFFSKAVVNNVENQYQIMENEMEDEIINNSSMVISASDFSIVEDKDGKYFVGIVNNPLGVDLEYVVVYIDIFDTDGYIIDSRAISFSTLGVNENYEFKLELTDEADSFDVPFIDVYEYE